MGKKVRPARKKNYRMQPVGPAFIEPEDHEAVCPHCHGAFSVGGIVVDNVIVADIRGRELSCAGAIEQVERELEPLMTEAELRDVATTVRERCGDRDLRKRQMHLMRLGRKYA